MKQGLSRVIGCILSIALNSAAADFSVALLGDLPYHNPRAEWEALIADINRAAPAFSVHIGDIKAGDMRCSDAYFAQILADFQRFAMPLIYTPGDNEWTDCVRGNNGGFNPYDRLARLRELFIPEGHSLGRRTLALEQQSAPFRENALWHYQGVSFATLHIVGSDNGMTRQGDDDEAIWAQRQTEAPLRNQHNMAWLQQAFSSARQRDSKGLMLFIHAHPKRLDRRDKLEDNPAYGEFLQVLEQQVNAFQRPVVLVHGDTHYFRIDKPLLDSDSGRRILNFTRVEVFGDTDVHWVEAIVDPNSAAVFSFQPRLVPPPPPAAQTKEP